MYTARTVSPWHFSGNTHGLESHATLSEKEKRRLGRAGARPSQIPRRPNSAALPVDKDREGNGRATPLSFVEILRNSLFSSVFENSKSLPKGQCLLLEQLLPVV